MHLTVRIDCPPLWRMARQPPLLGQLWRPALPQGLTCRSPSQMSAENEASKDRMEWGRLIQSIATDQDRAAFAALFGYFAPRIKSFLQRSGTSEARAEELAQETMLAVWRKAALFDWKAPAPQLGFSRSREICGSTLSGAIGGAARSRPRMLRLNFKWMNQRCRTPDWLRRSPRSESEPHLQSCPLTRYASSSCPFSKKRRTRISRGFWKSP